MRRSSDSLQRDAARAEIGRHVNHRQSNRQERAQDFVENEKHGDRRHVSVRAQDIAFVIERGGRKVEESDENKQALTRTSSPVRAA